MEFVFFIALCLLLLAVGKKLRGKLFIAPIIPALVALGQAGYQAYQAGRQRKMANSLRPSNYMPRSLSEAESVARADANATVSPGYTRGMEKARQISASTIDAAKRIGGNTNRIQQAVADADVREKEIAKDLEVNNEQFRSAKRRELRDVLSSKAGIEKSNYDAYAASKSALTGAAMQNEYNAISGAAEGLIYSLPDNAISPSTTGTNSSSTTSTSSALGRFGAGRGPYRYRSMRYTPYEESYLRSKGLI